MTLTPLSIEIASFRKLLHAIGDNRGQLHDLLTQSCVSGSTPPNAFPEECCANGASPNFSPAGIWEARWCAIRVPDARHRLSQSNDWA